MDRGARELRPHLMRLLYLLSVYLHILSATVWIGGIAFLVLVVVPWLRAGGRGVAGAFLLETGERFRSVGWICFAVLLVTGGFNLWIRGVTPGRFLQPEWLASSFGRMVLFKLSAFGAVLVAGIFHDFVIGPAAARAILADPESQEAGRLRRQAAMLGRVDALLALILVGLGVMLVRGPP
jgi:putative copper export protein